MLLNNKNVHRAVLRICFLLSNLSFYLFKIFICLVTFGQKTTNLMQNFLKILESKIKIRQSIIKNSWYSYNLPLLFIIK